MNLFADFYKFFKCRLFNRNSRKSAKKYLWIIRDKVIITNNWIRLLIFDDKINFYYFQPVPKQLISLL